MFAFQTPEDADEDQDMIDDDSEDDSGYPTLLRVAFIHSQLFSSRRLCRL